VHLSIRVFFSSTPTASIHLSSNLESTIVKLSGTVNAPSDIGCEINEDDQSDVSADDDTNIYTIAIHFTPIIIGCSNE
jgi:hypothetical protein